MTVGYSQGDVIASGLTACAITSTNPRWINQLSVSHGALLDVAFFDTEVAACSTLIGRSGRCLGLERMSQLVREPREKQAPQWEVDIDLSDLREPSWAMTPGSHKTAVIKLHCTPKPMNNRRL